MGLILYGDEGPDRPGLCKGLAIGPAGLPSGDGLGPLDPASGDGLGLLDLCEMTGDDGLGGTTTIGDGGRT